MRLGVSGAQPEAKFSMGSSRELCLMKNSRIYKRYFFKAIRNREDLKPMIFQAIDCFLGLGSAILNKSIVKFNQNLIYRYTRSQDILNHVIFGSFDIHLQDIDVRMSEF